LTTESIQKREERWAIVDLVGKGEHIRTVPFPAWVKDTLEAWLSAAEIKSGPLFRCVCRADKLWGQGISEKTVWHVVKKVATSMKIPHISSHDLRRSCARLCHASGGELEQIQFLLGHVSVQTTERYIGCKQRFRVAVNDKLGIEPG
jgi:site-specific recombinase XerD